ncbi:hypothetical protein MOV66_27385 [Agrobacterium sp. SHOUNA12C]|jgi:hypothetical protein|uniref:hypothetical protein n=1 Tax=Rhizobium rhizogenes TaxID=359 RepID=UPI0015744BC7|nr:hypothetical protein [Rhizobium rhizogenes]MCJ9724750.1 hypothetical protein [Agrobacterium sp. BETTINA12B]MCJ9760394.1 hypothetical protein [Agrobacterium sp. SHOUNA12C]NTF53048.1 hypothetical protein [Rhizobium rhizogenes]NTG18429.1 hypothetical protein [Rhizobium rhizogenes]NTG25496.1 hypothetical protein [Rhizobium rhizogenes]
MKSPWKFLVQLTSRGRSAEAREASIERDAKTTAIESEAEQTSVLPLDLTAASDRPDHDGTQPADLVATTPSNETESDLNLTPAILLPVAVEEVRASAREEVRQSSAEVHALVQENATNKKSPRAPQTKRPARAGRARTEMDAASTATTRQDQSAQSPSPLKTFFDEAVSLDEEIKQLRSQLAQKLHRQNSQLKKLLQRFDAS